MLQRARRSSAICVMTAGIAPCELTMTSLRQPARATLSPMAVQARAAIGGSDSVPENSVCSCEAPIDWTGRTARRGRPATARSPCRDSPA